MGLLKRIGVVGIVLVLVCLRGAAGSAGNERGGSPAVRSVELGRSIKGRAIRMHVFGAEGPAVLIFGGIHGNEAASQYVSLCLVDYLLCHNQLYKDRRVVIIPTANPDGILKNTRGNSRKVDCNRNFPTDNWGQKTRQRKVTPGSAPASEPETRAIVKAMKIFEPIHVAYRDIIPYCVNPDGPAMELVAAMAEKNGYTVQTSLGIKTPDSFGTWAGKEQQIPTITLELQDNRPWPELWNTHKEALIEAVCFSK